MGNFLSTNRANNNANISQQEPDPMIARLEERLARLERLDADKDGQISAEELNNWKKKQENDLQAFRQRIIEQETLRHQKTLIEKDAELTMLRKELTSLKQLLEQHTTNAQAEKERLVAALVRTDQASLGTGQAQSTTEALSEEQIRRFVEDLLSDDTVNIGYLPDWVERQLYVNFFNLLIGLLRKTVSSTSFRLIGHEVSMVMLPTGSERAVSGPDFNGEDGREGRETDSTS